ncbi:homeotic protein caudal [Anopheles ziemanni]|uniref:homeotic protein caudal n=1 Tax=Anopheles coustani TaxID=139045 RepID=UPI002659ADAD|nr:homeotic protein caudal [Anopheles coustani]XP_058168597.1 homeotic protein caudal [Anopheles ziemanni]
MVSYYNHFAMYPKNHSGNLPYSATSGWYPGNYQHQPPHPQFIGDGESSPQPTMYYPHPHVFHPQSSPDWSAHENFSTPPQTTLLPHGPSPGIGSGGGGGGGGGGGLGGLGGLHLGPGGPNHHHHHHHHHHSNNSAGNNNNSAHDHLTDGLHSIPSPPITVSGSDMSSPGAPTGSASPQITPRPTPVKSPYEWMKKQSYQSQPNPGGLINICSAPSLQDFAPVESGGKWKTRTKDKYRVVYTDQQRLELEKEFHYTRYITIRRKSELAQNLQLSERQVKIWFQNRRAKDRKQKKKAETGTGGGPQSLVGHPQGHNVHGAQSMSSLLGDTKPKLEPSLHLSHLHQMSAMSMGMGSMGLHHHPAHHPALHPHLGVPTSQHQLNQAAAAAAAASQVPPTSLSIM